MCDFGGKLCRAKSQLCRKLCRIAQFCTKQIFGLPLLIKANIEFFFSYLFLPYHSQISPVMVNLLLDFTSAVFNFKAQSVESIFLILCSLKLSVKQMKNTRDEHPIMYCKPLKLELRMMQTAMNYLIEVWIFRDVFSSVYKGK